MVQAEPWGTCTGKTGEDVRKAQTVNAPLHKLGLNTKLRLREGTREWFGHKNNGNRSGETSMVHTIA